MICQTRANKKISQSPMFCPVYLKVKFHSVRAFLCICFSMFPYIIFDTLHHLIVDFASSLESPNFLKFFLTSSSTVPSDPKHNNILTFVFLPLSFNMLFCCWYFVSLLLYDSDMYKSKRTVTSMISHSV